MNVRSSLLFQTNKQTLGHSLNITRHTDIIGGIINKLPIIGPLRVGIVKEFKSQLDNTLGPQVKTFLSSYNRVAVQRVTDFVLSPQNTASFRKANRNLVDSLLSRPTNTLLPSKETTEKAKQQLLEGVRNANIDEAIALLEALYKEPWSDKVFGEIVDVTQLLKQAGPAATSWIEASVAKFKASEQGQRVGKELLS